MIDRRIDPIGWMMKSRPTADELIASVPAAVPKFVTNDDDYSTVNDLDNVKLLTELNGPDVSNMRYSYAGIELAKRIYMTVLEGMKDRNDSWWKRYDGKGHAGNVKSEFYRVTKVDKAGKPHDEIKKVFRDRRIADSGVQDAAARLAMDIALKSAESRDPEIVNEWTQYIANTGNMRPVSARENLDRIVQKTHGKDIQAAMSDYAHDNAGSRVVGFHPVADLKQPAEWESVLKSIAGGRDIDELRPTLWMYLKFGPQSARQSNVDGLVKYFSNEYGIAKATVRSFITDAQKTLNAMSHEDIAKMDDIRRRIGSTDYYDDVLVDSFDRKRIMATRVLSANPVAFSAKYGLPVVEKGGRSYFVEEPQWRKIGLEWYLDMGDPEHTYSTTDILNGMSGKYDIDEADSSYNNPTSMAKLEPAAKHDMLLIIRELVDFYGMPEDRESFTNMVVSNMKRRNAMAVKRLGEHRIRRYAEEMIND